MKDLETAWFVRCAAALPEIGPRFFRIVCIAGVLRDLQSRFGHWKELCGITVEDQLCRFDPQRPEPATDGNILSRGTQDESRLFRVESVGQPDSNNNFCSAKR